jgi:2-aminoethylphosphonate-pyruvate transaminase
MQGSGTFGVEAVFQSAIPPEGKVAVLSNGAYGERLLLMPRTYQVNDYPGFYRNNVPSDFAVARSRQWQQVRPAKRPCQQDRMPAL